jgi:hypothetical protein
MSASRPSTLVVDDDDDDWGAVSPLPTTLSTLSRTSSPSVTASGSSSGEFKPYAAVGALLSGGGFKSEVWVLDPGTEFCLGKVGTNSKFCVKVISPGKAHCGILRHASKFSACTNTAYIRTSENQVLCQPTMDLEVFSTPQREAFLSTIRPAAEWERVFSSIHTGDFPEWLALESNKASLPDDDDGPLQLLSPVTTKTKHGCFVIFPTFSFDSTSSEEGQKGELGHLTAEERLVKVESRLSILKTKLTSPFVDIDAAYAVLSSDIVKLHGKVTHLSEVVGAHRASDSLSSIVQQVVQRCRHLDEGRTQLANQLSRVLSVQDDLKATVNTAVEEVAELQAVSQHTDAWIATADKTLDVFRQRFKNIKPLLAKLMARESEPEDEFLAVPNQGPTFSAPTHEEDSLSRRLQDLEEKLKIVENRVVGAGVQLGGCVFQSFEDLLTWVRVKVPKGRFGLFVDGHSFLEFFTLSGHIDTEAGTAAFSNSQKAGFSTYIEAQLAISFKNLFPAVFGKGGSSSLDDSECLPAISNGAKWNNGSTGLHHQLMRNMNDVSYQLDSTIKKVLKDHQEAKQLAIDCVTASKRFVIDLITFMSQEYSTWQQRGFTTKAAWQVVCQIVRRIFEDLQSARISARNVQDLDDTDFTTASFIYATLKCHDIMEAYVKHQFHAHPHVSSVITRHLAANFIKPDQSAESLENKVIALAGKVDSLTSKLNLYVDKEKEKARLAKEKNAKNAKNARGTLDGATA